jgi:hypothetical protein
MRAQVFIIESLDKQDYREGEIIDSILRMGGKYPIYRFVKTRDQLEDAIAEFHACKYRYLHISSHGNSHQFWFRFGPLDFEEFAEMLRRSLRHRRLFVSACQCVNSKFAGLLIPNSDCYSIIGPYEAIDFDVAAVTWASYYYLAFRNDQQSMNRRKIRRRLKKLTNLFHVNLNYYAPVHGRMKRVRFTGKRGTTLKKK